MPTFLRRGNGPVPIQARPGALGFAFAFTLISLVSSLAFGGQERPKLVVGAVLPMTGPQAPFGLEAERGMSLALDVVKQKDPDIAATITLAIADEKSSPREVVPAIEQLVAKDKAHVFIGSLTGLQSQALVDSTAVRGRPIVVPSPGALAVPSGTSVTRVALDEGEQSAALAEYLMTTRKAKAIWVLRDDGEAARRTAERFAAAIAARGGAVKGTEVFELGAEDFAAALGRLKAADADFLFVPASFHTASGVAKAAKAAGTKLVLVGTDAWDTPQLSRIAGEAANGMIHTAAFAADDPDPATAAFVSAFKAKFGRAPGSVAALAFDSMLLVADAVKRAGANQAAALTLELRRTMNLAGATGIITHATDGSPQKTAIIKEVSASVPAGAVFRARVLAPGVGAAAGNAATPAGPRTAAHEPPLSAAKAAPLAPAGAAPAVPASAAKP